MTIPSDSSKLFYTLDGGDFTDVSAVATGAAAAITATIPAVAGKTAYATGFIITGGGATAGSLVTATLVGVLGGTHSYVISVPTGATLGITPIIRPFARPLAATGPNVAIVLSLPSLGAGNTAAAININGYYI